MTHAPFIMYLPPREALPPCCSASFQAAPPSLASSWHGAKEREGGRIPEMGTSKFWITPRTPKGKVMPSPGIFFFQELHPVFVDAKVITSGKFISNLMSDIFSCFYLCLPPNILCKHKRTGFSSSVIVCLKAGGRGESFQKIQKNLFAINVLKSFELLVNKLTVNFLSASLLIQFLFIIFLILRM